MMQRLRQGTMKPASRRGLAVLVLVWLNMVVLPCAMAFGNDQDCPNCVPAAELEIAHYGQTVESDCITMQSDDCYPGEISTNSRVSKTQNLPDDPETLAPPPRPGLTLAGHSVPASVNRPPDPGRASPQLHVLYCVYLK